MDRVHIPFLAEFEQPLVSGAKTLTARTKRYGKPGDIFKAFGQTFVIESIREVPLSYVASQWKKEGCHSKDHFLEVWGQIHKRKPYNPRTLVWLHEFSLITEEDEPLSFKEFMKCASAIRGAEGSL